MRHEPIQVVVVDAEPAFRAGVKAALPDNRFRVLGEAASISHLNRGTLAGADVILASEEAAARAPRGWANRGSYAIFARTPTVKGLRAALAAGALGYVSREIEPARLPLVVADLASGVPVLAPTVATALLVELVHRPGPRVGRLTPRQEQVLSLADEGVSSGEIARILDLSPVTVRRHLADARAKVVAATAVVKASSGRRLPLTCTAPSTE
jgi:DNA-binding NarL/FixJ family response regulator